MCKACVVGHANSLVCYIDDTTNTQTLITTLLQLYLSLVHPHTEYATPVWDPHLLSNINSLEIVQKFALHVCCKQWDAAYSELLCWSNVPSLEMYIRLYLKLCHLFKFVNNICYFPPGIVVPNTNLSHSSFKTSVGVFT